MEKQGIIDRLKNLLRSAVMLEVTPGVWKKVIGPTELLNTLPYGGKIMLGFDCLEIFGANTIGSGRCDVSGGLGHYVLNGFNLDQATLKDA